MVVDELVILVEEMEHGLKAHSRRLDQERIDSVTSPDLGRVGVEIELKVCSRIIKRMSIEKEVKTMSS
jgi:hypothetical protein